MKNLNSYFRTHSITFLFSSLRPNTDKMPYNHYLQISEERYDLLCKRFDNYILTVDDITKEPFKLFDPLNSQQIQELELIREVSRDLQNKKEEDKKKAAEAALEDKNDSKEKKESEKTEKTNEAEIKESEKQTEVTPVEN